MSTRRIVAEYLEEEERNAGADDAEGEGREEWSRSIVSMMLDQQGGEREKDCKERRRSSVGTQRGSYGSVQTFCGGDGERLYKSGELRSLC